VIEFRMANAKSGDYGTADEVIEDLEAVRRGEPPMIAESKLDMNLIGEIEREGTAFDRRWMKISPSSRRRRISRPCGDVGVVVVLVVVIIMLVLAMRG